MKSICTIFFLCLLAFCSIAQSTNKNAVVDTNKNKFGVDYTKMNSVDTAVVQTDSTMAYQIFYVVVADTSKNYFLLKNKMIALSKTMHVKIDMLYRTFNKKRNLICLPENAEDKIYAGQYFPRRYGNDFLSLEYIDYYTGASTFSFDTGTNRTIGLIVGLYSEKAVADSMVSILQHKSEKAFTIQANIYIGCMH